MLANPERLFDHAWRWRHPLRPRLSRLRKWGMLALLLLLSGTILGYSWLTNPDRVRSIASAYLSELLGGEVKIGQANLSIFEGLSLDDVTVRLPNRTGPDAVIFQAKSLLLLYRPAELLAGKLVATQIVATDPTVLLVEDVQTHRWNFQQMWQNASDTRKAKTQATGKAIAIPQIILRDAQVRYLQIDGKKMKQLGWYGMDAQLSPSDETDRYDFELQSRGTEAIGPSVEGYFRTDGGASVARLRNFTFGPDMNAMLPAKPRAWCEWHELQGRMDVPELIYLPGHNATKPSFHVEILLSNVEMAVHPEEWMSRQRNENVKLLHDELDRAVERKWISDDHANIIRQLSTPKPVHLRQVSGTFDFDENGVQLNGITGKLENNWFNIDGSLGGYSPDSAAAITVSSVEGQELELPAWSPQLAGALPTEAQEIYEKLHPQGKCSGWVKLVRGDGGAKPSVTGQLNIHDGQIRFEDFPYPLSRATGTVLLGPDPLAQMDGIRLLNVQAHGAVGGPNENSVVTLDGFIGPLEGVAGVWIDIRGNSMYSEPAVTSALPPPAQRALALFDPGGHGDLPTFHGSFTCRIARPIGSHTRWKIATDVDLEDAAGTLTAFPYPIHGLSGRLEIRDGYLNIVNVHTTRGSAEIGINGKVSWRTKLTATSTQPFGPDIVITAKNLPIDDDLKEALSSSQRQWLNKLGITGALDVTGHITPVQNPNDANRGRQVNWIINAKLHDGRLQPGNGSFALANLQGNLQITPDRLRLSEVTANRGACTVGADAAVDLSGDTPKLSLSATANNLLLDPNLYQVLPAAAKKGWDAVQPAGTVDAALTYDALIPSDQSANLPADSAAIAPPSQSLSNVQLTAGEPEALSTAPAPGDFLLEIRPRQLSVTPAALPYRLDQLAGLVTVTSQQVVLSDLVGHHGDATIHLAGHGPTTGPSNWDMKLRVENLPINTDLTSALPPSVSAVLKSLKANGKIGIDFTRLTYRQAPTTQPQTTITNTSPQARLLGSDVDMDMAARITLNGDSADVGLDATEVRGTINVAGLVRGGKLSRFAADINADSLKLGGWAASNFAVSLAKESDDNIVQVPRIEGQFVDGDLAGDGQFTNPDSGPGQFTVRLVLHNADVRQLEFSNDPKLEGRLTASLEMSGNFGDPNSRRGHGDVGVNGKDMYDFPMVLGLLQVTNLGLPINSPLSEASTRYRVDGRKIDFERIDLKSNNMTLSGAGELDYAAKKVSLWFVTDNPAILALPVLGPLIHSAKSELFKIHITGNVEQPKISTSSFNTVTTTVDQVLNGDDADKQQ